MNDVETLLRSTYEAVATPANTLFGPALRQRARRRQHTVRAGSAAVLVAASAAVATAVPAYLHHDDQASAGPRPAEPCVRHSDMASALTTVARNSASITRARWTPAGRLIDEPEIQRKAVAAAAWDCDYQLPTGPRIDPTTARVVYAAYADIDGSPRGQRAIVVVAGDTSGPNPQPALALLTTLAGGVDNAQFTSLTLVGQHPSEAQASIAGVHGGRDNGVVWVVADGGVTNGKCTYGETGNSHSIDMDIKDGIATCPSRHAELQAGKDGPLEQITRVVAYAGRAKVWDDAPVEMR